MSLARHIPVLLLDFNQVTWQDTNQETGKILLDSAVVHHLSKVLRKAKGDELKIYFENKALLLRVQLEEISASTGLLFKVISQDTELTQVRLRALTQENQKSQTLEIALSALKHFDHVEWCVQKLVELGCTQITLLACEWTQLPFEAFKQGSARFEKLQKTIRQACEQSERFFVPHLKTIQFKEWLQAKIPSKNSLFYGAVALPAQTETQILTKQPCSFAVGPEGGFSPNEEELLLQAGAQSIHMSAGILRTETAALAGFLHLLQKM